MKIFIFIYVVLISIITISLFQDKELEESMERGSKLYKSKCAACHKKDGTGRGKNFPPLANSDYLMQFREESIKAVKYGLDKEIIVNGKTYSNRMKPIKLDDRQIADVMNFVMNSWNNSSEKIVTPDEVEASIP